MGSSLTCKLDPCCGDTHNCIPPMSFNKTPRPSTYDDGFEAGLKAAAKAAHEKGRVDWEDGSGGDYGDGFEAACSEVGDAILALKEGPSS